MDSKENGNPSATRHGPEESKDIQKGAWTEEEDSILGEFIQNHGQGHWDLVARCTGLKRTGKSCRLRWLNYLRPGIRHGNFTLEEQLKILCLHLVWGNCWSKIAESLHGRTDNEIKNYWRTRVQRQAKQLNCSVNSKEFRSIIRSVLIPRVAEQIRSESPGYSPEVLVSPVLSSTSNLVTGYCNDKASIMEDNSAPQERPFQNDYDDVIVADQVGDDIWNDENVEFLRQQLHVDADI